MQQSIREFVVASADHEVRLRDLRIPAGARVEVVVNIEPAAAEPAAGPANQWLWDLVARAGGTRSGQEIIDELRRERDEWDER